jgi:hypothetical protein
VRLVLSSVASAAQFKRSVEVMWGLLLELVAAGPTTQAQFLVNTNFETFTATGIASNWTQQAGGGASTSFAQETVNPHSGTSCQRVVVSGSNQTNLALPYQAFPWQAGHVCSVGNGKRFIVQLYHWVGGVLPAEVNTPMLK